MLPLAFWLQHVSTKFFINIVIAGEPRAGVSICTFMQERPLCLLSELRGASVVIIVSQRACLCINIWASSQLRAQTPLSVDKKIKKHYMSLKGRLCDVVFTYMWVSVFFPLMRFLCLLLFCSFSEENDDDGSVDKTNRCTLVWEVICSCHLFALCENYDRRWMFCYHLCQLFMTAISRVCLL